MKTCKNCIHYDVCIESGRIILEFYGENEAINFCSYFKDVYKFIKLPCSIGDYCIYQDDLWYVNNITYCCDGSFLLWISMADKSPCGVEVPASEVKFISEEDAKNWR